ncbi:MAG: NAD(P)-dependent oxidoreductase [Nitritalea sp.]
MTQQLPSSSAAPRVLIIDEMHASIGPLLEAAGFLPNYQPRIGREGILSQLPHYQGLILRSKTAVDAELLRHAPALRFIGRAGAGLDQIDVEALRAKGIQLFHAAEGNKDAVGEHALGMLLALFNHLMVADAQVRKGIWKREANRGEELAGKVVGIIGFGNMGQAFAKKLAGFDVQLLAYDKYKQGFGSEQVREVELEELFERAEVLSVHVPLTSETRNMLDIDFFRRFRNPLYLINTARGELSTFHTLNQAFQEGLLKGAVLDVLENERFERFSAEQQEQFQLLATRENVLFSPHVAGWTHQSYAKINEVLVAKIQAAGFSGL